ncbi:MAG: hypothetical protein EAX96_20405 [Candidatus Lokiarchaeota archaeon]|nr:hypothetical protein [Candidatus Lokiarchaeota archaeon]
MRKITSDFTFDDLNEFIEVIDEVYQLAKYRIYNENLNDDKEILANCLIIKKELEQYKQNLILYV